MGKLLSLGIALLAALLFYGAAMAGAQSLNSSSNLTAAINSTQQYISKVNQSAYILFYPNLAASYAYLNLAENVSSTNASYSYALLAKARASAQNQEAGISKYEQISLYVLVALAILLAIILYAFMIPYKKRENQQNTAK